MNESQTSAPQAKTTSGKSAIPSETVRPTKKQKELLEFIEKFIAQHGYSPSYREIMNGLDYRAVATVAQHIQSLIRRGHLRKRDHSARSLEVVAPTGAPDSLVPTNQVKAADEKWLVERVTQLFADVESQATVTQEQLGDIQIVLAAMRIIGLESATQSFATRLTELKKTQVV
ncbi:MAG: repressor LexA [Patescibacteria group bacterium]|nr:hypothetical protein [Candidatus Saccharibacteria bacterium]MDQ5963567.1 repressor LexA [Patescibacteria group bacterium]